MFKHEGNSIYLNGLKVPLDIFLRLEPSYSYPKDLVVMFYDGKIRNYRTAQRSWTLGGRWENGERYLNRVEEFAALVEEEEKLDREAIGAVKAAVTQAQKDKYPTEDKPNVIKLHERDDQHKSGTEGVRSKGKRVSRPGGKRSGGATGGSSE